MKLTKQLEKDVRQVYLAYWESYFGGNLRKFASLIDADYKLIGTAEIEVLSGKPAALHWLRSAVKEIKGKAEFRNRRIKLSPVNELVLVTELAEAYILAGRTWKFYSKVRVTTLLRLTKSGWKVVQQHGSLPDPRTGEGETVSFETLSRENLQLRDAVKRRTAELENKNRELEIEAALERVRAVAMGMKKSGDLLAVCKTGFKELKKLGFSDLRNMIIHTYVDEQKYFNDYDYSDALGGAVARVPYTGNPVIEKFIKTIRKGKTAFSEIKITGKQLEDWKKFRKANKEPVDPRLNKASSLYYYIYSVGAGSIGISTFSPIDTAQRDILIRFRNVFDLSYQRYLDIEKAEAQAREAQIELALEKVRARSMAMHRSDELVDTSVVLFQELKSLGVNVIRTGVAIIDEANEMMELWSSQLIEQKQNKVLGTIHMNVHPFFSRLLRAWKRKDPDFTYDMRGNQVKNYYRVTSAYLSYPHQNKINPREIFNPFFFPEGALSVVTYVPLTREERSIMQRFTRVFGLLYRRFLDLQKAEAQAREAQIQLALERVRARTMAMHHSYEITEVVKLLYREFDKLNISNESTDIEIGLIDEETGIASIWAHFYASDGVITTFQIPIARFKGTADEYKKWKATPVEKRIDLFFTSDFSGKKWDSIKAWVNKSPELAEIFRPLLEANITRWVTHNAYFSHGLLTLQGTEPYPAETLEIQKRFTKVFEQTYTRFLDLQKAEAQAREGQIELALERVRARTMAMYKSDELSQVAALLYNELKGLGVSRFINCGYVEIDEAANIQYAWMTIADGTGVNAVRLPLTGDLVFDKRYDAWKRKVEIFHQTVSGDLLKKHIEFATKHYRETEIDLMVRTRFADPTIFYCSNFSHGYLHIVTDEPLTEEAESLLIRFTRVFEMTYKRFLDLKKAEAQAREAQVEAALERVRSRSMGMHKSEELLEAGEILCSEMSKLGIGCLTSGYVLMDEEEKIGWNYTPHPATGKIMPEAVGIPHTLTKEMKRGLASWKKQEPVCVIEMNEKETIAHQTFIAEKSIHFPLSAEELIAISPRRLVLHNFNFRQGYLLIVGGEKLTDEQVDIMLRFTRVFQQTYTRFLDLQKAEAQAREAQIEAALEKVRSRVMAMNSSNDLPETSFVFGEQLRKLGIDWQFSYFWLIEEDRDDNTFWITWPDHKTSTTVYSLAEADENFRECIIAWRKQEKIHGTHVPVEHVQSWLDTFERITADAGGAAVEIMKAGNFTVGVYYYDAMIKFGSFGILMNRATTDQEKNIQARFANEFERAYTRFLDLQKAEMQAREAQIEAALERVRSRSMGMQKSEELKEVIKIVYQQLTHLKIKLDHAGFVVDYTPGGDWHFWIADEQDIPSKISHPYFKSVWASQFRQAKENGADFFATRLNFEEKNKFYNELLAYVPGLPEASKEFYLSCPGLAATTVLMDNVALYIENFSGVPFTAEENAVLMRFGKVFQQSYTRFLDLQKAEAQAKEAQIETAMERIRARAMAMHTSGELMEVANVLREQMGLLNQPDLETSAVLIYHDDLASWDSWYAFRPTRDEKGKIRNGTATFSKDDCALTREIAEHFRSPETDYTLAVGGARREEWLAVLMKAAPEVAENAISDETVIYDTTYFHFSDFKGGSLLTVSYLPPGDEIKSLQRRAASVFDLAYRRFRDLQKAEAQAREAEIQLALERVRARAMAMHRSEELLEVIMVVSEQIKALKIRFDFACFGIKSPGDDFDFWMAVKGQEKPFFIHAPYIDSPMVNRVKQAQQQGVDFFTDTFDPEENRLWLEHLFRWNDLDLPRETKSYLLNSPGLCRTSVLHKSINFFIGNYGAVPFSEEENKIFVRFATAFEQSYTRFLDLQKAEAQAREAQVELSLERIRAKVTAMQESSELLDIVVAMRTEFVSLGHEAHYFWYMRWLPEKYEKAMTSGDGTRIGMVMELPRHMHGDIPLLADWEKSEEPAVVYAMDVEAAVDYVDKMIKLGDFKQVDHNAPTLDDIRHIGGLTFIMARTTHGEIGYSLPGVVPHPPADSIATLIRFAAVFDLAYRRFEDLKSAERQHREAQVDLALERVRARTMAMQSSTELNDAANVLFRQVRELGIHAWSAGYGTWMEGRKGVTLYMSSEDQMQVPFEYPHTEDPVSIRFTEAAKRGEALYVEEMGGEDLAAHYRYMRSLPKVGEMLEEIRKAGFDVPVFQVFHLAYYSHGYLLFITYEPVPEAWDIFRRFAGVFEQTYTRFLDLQKAEAQAREAQIEAALERVRSRSMAMHKSDELADLSSELVKQVQNLGVATWFCAFNIHDNDSRGSLEWGSNGNMAFKAYRTPREGIFLKYFEAGQRGETLLIHEIGEKDCPAHYEYLCSLPGVGEQLLQMKSEGIPFPAYQIDHVAYFKYGYLLFITYEPVPEAHDIFKRFAKVFEQTYTRFLDLQRAEAQAKEAKIEASLERVRSRAMAMHSSQDLADTIGVFYRELQNFSLTPRRCGVGLLNREDRSGELFTWNTTEEGHSLELVGKLSMEGHPVLINVYEHWIAQKEYHPVLRGMEIPEYYKVIRPQMPFPDYKQDEVQYGYFFFFPEGGVYAWTTIEMSEEELTIYRRFTSVLSLTYKRYKDLQQAEALARQAELDLVLLKEEKKRTEEALAELQVTQRQLIQSEKMASLGELTAGIAHEIQNPLNFVNNFSEVSNELLDEMLIEAAKGNLAEVKEILNDVKQNLEKITHHGKRADGIVKGMLQHSRSSSGQKEPTDINALADEYLRLAYHGLRAKDKSFNATMKTAYEVGLPKVNVIPQDIGRVVLNLITNAFYAVNEKKNSGINGYEPTVTVSTKQAGDKIELSVKDNGNGIPETIREKIFQPFFTTKPTGQGTGLGLSLSYDIVKAHGGELKVETTAGGGTKFIVRLNQN